MRRFWIYFGLANIIGGVFLWLAARELPVAETWEYLRDIPPEQLFLPVAAFLGLYGVCHGARIARWYNLVEPIGDVERATVTRVCIVGFTAILLLPLRLGEFVRPYLLAKKSELSMSSVLGTAVVERVVDGLCVTGLLFATLATYGGDEATVAARGAGYVSAAIFIPAFTIALLANWRRDWTVGMVRRVGGWVSTRLADTAADMLDAFIEGLSGLRAGGHLWSFLGWTALYWGTNVISMWVLATWGFGLEVGAWQMATVMSVLVVGIMIPAGPAMAGNFEYFVAAGLALFVAIEQPDVAVRVGAFAATLHVLQFVVIVVPGFGVMWVDPETRHLVSVASRANKQVTE